MATNCANRRARQATRLALNFDYPGAESWRENLQSLEISKYRQFNGEFFMTFIAKHISVSIDLSAAQVYEFASNPENLPNGPGA
jgi:hypothetical protein